MITADQVGDYQWDNYRHDISILILYHCLVQTSLRKHVYRSCTFCSWREHYSKRVRATLVLDHANKQWISTQTNARYSKIGCGIAERRTTHTNSRAGAAERYPMTCSPEDIEAVYDERMLNHVITKRKPAYSGDQ